MQTAENRTRYLGSFAVAPLAGAWIEIINLSFKPNGYIVAPLAGAWIEISVFGQDGTAAEVAPLAGAWIEITYFIISLGCISSRSPRGSVD